MPKLEKKSVSLFLRNSCQRQLVLSMYSDPERRQYGLPPRQKQRAALGLVGEAGYEWQNEKVAELRDVFGADNVMMGPVGTKNHVESIKLDSVLSGARPFTFIVEAAYTANTNVFVSSLELGDLEDLHGNAIRIGDMRPDIIQVLPPLSSGLLLGPQTERNPYQLGVSSIGDTFRLPENDTRLRLRVIDVKLTSEPGPHYFAEVVLYSMTLSAWLTENKLDDRFVVVSAPAVWPGSHEASNLVQQKSEWNKRAHEPTAEELSTALEDDIELSPVDVFAPRLRRFLKEELPKFVNTPWQELDWHVDEKCRGCEFLGFPWTDKEGNVQNDPSQCWPTAARIDHLSRVDGLSKGGCGKLRERQIADVPTLASTSSKDRVFNLHQGLRAKRSTFPHRALSLLNTTTSIIPHSGGDALMPRWPDLHIYMFIDYDLSSAITVAFTVRAFWLEPSDFNRILTDRASRVWSSKSGESEAFIVDQPTVEREREEFLKFLRHLRAILNEVSQHDDASITAGRHSKPSTYQIYLWDESQRKHLVRLIGRHLAHVLADSELHNLAWLFPPIELLQYPDDATHRSPITLVSNVVENVVAVPVPHYYRLLDVADFYHSDFFVPRSVHPLYEEPMSNQIPGERIHEFWKKRGNWVYRLDLISETTKKKVAALETVVRKLETDLSKLLSRQAAPPVVRPTRSLGGISAQSLMWLEYSRLNTALDTLDIQTTRSMPPHERAARLKSARLLRRLSGEEEQSALELLRIASGRSLTASPTLFIYELREDSREVNMKQDDFLLALSPETRYGFLDESAYALVKDTPLETSIVARKKSVADAGITRVSIEAIDRTNGFIALKAGFQNCIGQLEVLGIADFSANVILDVVHDDYLTDKLALTLKAIGNPTIAVESSRVLEALGLPASPQSTPTRLTPAAEVLWGAPKLHDKLVSRNLPPIRQLLQLNLNQRGMALDHSQWDAWEHALTRRFELLWGPPGTGKSRTLRAIVIALVLDALTNQKPMRILITANTYTAVDNVLLELDSDLRGIIPDQSYTLARIQSKWQPEPPGLATKAPGIQSLVLNTAQPSPEVLSLRDTLERRESIVIVGSVPQQLHNLAVAGIRKQNRRPAQTVRTWFDQIVLDEASQIDVATSTLIFSKLADGGSCVLAGDDLQLPPIQKAEPPLDLDNLVGSAYSYFRHHHGIEPSALDVNYRSNETIVELVKLAGYSPKLRSHSPDLRLSFVSPLPVQEPGDWPKDLVWNNNLSRLLDPQHPTTCFIYDDIVSSQVNEFESQTIAALLRLLSGLLADRLLNEDEGKTENTSAPVVAPYMPAKFWTKAVGVVTPHRAQMANVVSRLQGVFPSDSPFDIRSAVDTVERFQGQQRDIIIASFGLGDPDIIGREDEFLFDLKRFNVLVSRARAKLVVFVTRTLLEHLSDDRDVLEESRLLKQYCESFCQDPQPLSLGFWEEGQAIHRNGVLRQH